MRIERTLGLVALAAFLPLMAMERANAVDWTPPSLTSGSFVDSIAETAQYFGVSEVRLGPGDSIAAPQVLATVSAGGADGVAQAFHRVCILGAPAASKRVPGQFT